MDSPDTWQWVWLVAAAVLIIGEIVAAPSLFLLPFAAGALAAAALAFAGVNVAVEWIAFLAVSVAALFALAPLRRKLDRDIPHQGIGSARLIGQPATVLRAVPAGHTESGVVRVGREQWRADSLDGQAIPEGAEVHVVEVRGTRVVVHRPVVPSTEHKELS